METDYTAQEHAELLRAKAKGPRIADQEEHRLIAARKRRFTERGNAEVARFREEHWPAIRDRAAAESAKYAAYRADVLKLEDALQRIRGLAERTVKAPALLDALERAAFPVRGWRSTRRGSRKPLTPRSCCARSSCCTPRSRCARRRRRRASARTVRGLRDRP